MCLIHMLDQSPGLIFLLISFSALLEKHIYFDLHVVFMLECGSIVLYGFCSFNISVFKRYYSDNFSSSSFKNIFLLIVSVEFPYRISF